MKETTQTVGRQRVAARLRRLAFPLPFACLYVSFGATLGLLGGGAPLVLRAHGLSLDKVGLIQLMYLPIGMTFLWAPCIDRWKLPGVPHRVGWIAAAQLVTVVILLGMSAVFGSSRTVALVALLVAAFGVSIAQATMDIALEALVVETVAREWRPIVTTAKLCGSSLGTMVGISLATVLPTLLPLPAALVVVALLDAVMLLPILRVAEPDRPGDGGYTARIIGRVPAIARRAAVLGCYFAPAIMLSSQTSLVLLDLKVPLRAVGLLTGVVGTLVGVAMTLVSGTLLTRFDGWRLVAIFAMGVTASGFIFAAASWTGLVSLGLLAGATNLVCDGAMGVPIFNVIYRWAEGTHAATDYALLFGIAFLVSFPARIAGPALASAIGWPAFYLVNVPLYGAAVAVLARTMRASDPVHPVLIQGATS